jgi:8-amino-7-oxononanoate synthase
VPHGDVDAIAEALLTPGVRRRFVVVEAVYSMDGTRAPLEAIAALCEAHDAGLIVDEAHATGMWGPRGAGLTSVLSRRASLLATVHPCGKALGGAGAFVAGSRALRDWLIQRARPFVFSTALPPYVALGLDAALDVIAAEPALRRRPLALADALRTRLHAPASGGVPVDTGGSASAIVPVITGDPASALRLQAGLAERGWHARAIRPPTVPAGTCRVRLVLRAPLREAQVEALAADVLDLAEPA